MSSDAERRTQLEALLNQAWREHRGEVVSRVNLLREVLSAYRAGALDDTVRVQANSTAHRLAGVLGTFGLREASRAALEIETMLLADREFTPDMILKYEDYLGTIDDGLSKRDREAD